MDTNVFDPDWVNQQRIASLRKQADDQNSLHLQQYNGAAADWVTNNLRNRDLGLPITAVPTPPAKIVVDDSGNDSRIDWPGLQPPILPPPVLNTGTGGIRATAGLPPDRIDQILAMLRAIGAKLGL